jgi:hypothetical protein
MEFFYDLTGTAGGGWRTRQGVPSAAISIETPDCNIHASRRYANGEAVSRAIFSGREGTRGPGLPKRCIIAGEDLRGCHSHRCEATPNVSRPPV